MFRSRFFVILNESVFGTVVWSCLIAASLVTTGERKYLYFSNQKMTESNLDVSSDGEQAGP